MPTLFRLLGYRFFFYSNEGDPRELPHVHVARDTAEAKLWLRPDVSVARSAGFSARDLRQIVAVTEEQRDRIERGWHDYFG